ncbi:MAG: hypothetical protein P4L57_08390 [Rhizomicrobium sp.]|nr:hypothetical protein [Rhizomicrobium sp.]
MLNRVAAVAVLACLLGGCTDANWDHSLSYIGLGERPAPAAPVSPPTTTAPPAAMPQSDPWCEAAGKAAAQESREQGFDEATQRRQAEAARLQCLHQ